MVGWFALISVQIGLNLLIHINIVLRQILPHLVRLYNHQGVYSRVPPFRPNVPPYAQAKTVPPLTVTGPRKSVSITLCIERAIACVSLTVPAVSDGSEVSECEQGSRQSARVTKYAGKTVHNILWRMTVWVVSLKVSRSFQNSTAALIKALVGRESCSIIIYF